MITLKSSRLTLHICEPGEMPNRTFRFDRAGFISEVILDGSRYFCASEPHCLVHPSSGGRGFCSEIIFDPSGEIPVGERFPKLGVGNLLKTDDKPYCFFQKYDAELFPVDWESHENSVVFYTRAIPCHGYAAEMKKQITVIDNLLSVDYSLKNTGSKPVRIREYCHNFISIGGMAIGPDYLLKLPCVEGIPNGDLPDSSGFVNYVGENHCLRVKAYSKKAALIRFKQDQITPSRPFEWSLCNIADGAAVHGRESFIPSGLAVWSIDHMVSPEVFHDFRLAPGETECWTRACRFDTCEG